MDYHQDIARSSYADMLNDDERNHAYHLAIKAAVSHMVSSPEMNPNGDRYFRCCDIGTGSGLLSMMIVNTFTSLKYEHFEITAFEAFPPMAECAQKVIASNEMSSKINVITGRSNDFALDEGVKFDLLVAELLDTELIGEGCLLTYRHAVENLCTLNCIFIPQQANIYIQPLESQYLINRQLLQDMQLTLVNCNKPSQTKAITVRVSDDVKSCCGLAEIDDMQLSRLYEENFTQLAEPELVFSFKFNDLDSLKLRDEKVVRFIKTTTRDIPSGGPVVIAMWWDIVMYEEHLFEKYIRKTLAKQPAKPHSFSILSCAPDWYRHKLYKERDQYIVATYGRKVWREHWIQGIYYLTSGPELDPTNGLTIYAHHDSHSLWFDTKPCESKLPDTCTCGVHRLLSRSDFAFLNNSELMSKLASALLYRRHIKTLPTRAKIVFNRRKVSTRYSTVSGGDGETRDEQEETNNDHRWQINFWNDNGQQLPEILFDYKLQDEVSWSRLIGRHSNGDPIAPFVGFEIKCLQVCFEDLNRIRTNVSCCQGFNLTHLDELIEESSKLIDSSTESHHLCEYECQLIGDDDTASNLETVIFSSENLTVDQRHLITASKFIKHLKLQVPPEETFAKLRHGWALVFWADFKLINGDILSSGYSRASNIHQRAITWNPYFRQLIHFLHDHPILSTSCQDEPKILELDIELSLDEVKVKRSC